MTSTYNYQRNNEGDYNAVSSLEHASPTLIVPEIVSLNPKYTGLYLYGPNQRYVPDNSLDTYPGDRPQEREITGLNLNTIFGNNINKFLSCGVKFYSTNDPVHSGDNPGNLSLIYGRNGNSLRFTAISKNIVVTATHFTSSPQNYAGQTVVYFYHNNQIISRTIQKTITLKQSIGNGISTQGIVVCERINGVVVQTNYTSDFLNYFSELSPTNYLDLITKMGSGGQYTAFYDTVMFILNEPLPDDLITPYILENDTLRDLISVSESSKYLQTFGIDQENHLRYCSKLFDDLIFLFDYKYRIFLDPDLIKNLYLNYTNLAIDETNKEIKLDKILTATAFNAAVFHDSSSPMYWFDDSLSKPIIHRICLYPSDMTPFQYDTSEIGGAGFGSGIIPTTNIVEKFYNYLIQFGAIPPSILKINDQQYITYKNSVIKLKNKHKNYQQYVSKIIDKTISQSSLINIAFTTNNKKLKPFISFIPANTDIKKTLEVDGINYDNILTKIYTTEYSPFTTEYTPFFNTEDYGILKYSKFLENNSVTSFKLIKNKYLIFNLTSFFGKLDSVGSDGRFICNDPNEISYATTNVNSLYFNSEINGENYLDYSIEVEFFDEYNGELHELNSNYIFNYSKILNGNLSNIPSFQTVPNISTWYNFFLRNKNTIDAVISPTNTDNTNKLIYNNFNETASVLSDNRFKAINFGSIIGNLIIKCKIFKNNQIDKEYTIKFYKNNKENIINVTGYNLATENNIVLYSEVAEDVEVEVCPESGLPSFNRFFDINYNSLINLENGIVLYPDIKQENINILDYPFGITTSEIVETPIQTNESTNGSSIPTSSKIRVQAVKNSSGTYDIIETIESGE